MRKALGELSWKATILLGIVIGIQGALLVLSLYLGFFANNFTPFYTILAGTGWFVFMVDRITTWGRE